MGKENCTNIKHTVCIYIVIITFRQFFKGCCFKGLKVDRNSKKKLPGVQDIGESISNSNNSGKILLNSKPLEGILIMGQEKLWKNLSF